MSMKAAFINPFVVSAFGVLERAAGVKGEKGPVSASDRPGVNRDVTIIIGVTGMLRGQVTVGMSEQAAINLSSSMLFGLDIPELDPMSLSAVGEFANMLIGNAGILLSNEGYSCDISPPEIVYRSPPKSQLVEIRTIVLLIRSELGDIEVQIALAEKGAA